jgi:hypothetical protein
LIFPFKNILEKQIKVAQFVFPPSRSTTWLPLRKQQFRVWVEHDWRGETGCASTKILVSEKGKAEWNNPMELVNNMSQDYNIYQWFCNFPKKS